VPPLQATLVTTVVPETAAAGAVTDIPDTVPVQPLASVIVTEYVPAASPVLSSVVILPPQLNVYGPVPPVGVKLIAPVVAPLQAILVTTVVPDIVDAGAVTDIPDTVPVQPLASVIVTE
jgi:hypothetical protein